MNYAHIVNYARAVMDDHGIVIPRDVDIMHYIRFVAFIASLGNEVLTDRQIAYRVIEIARYDYIATAAKCAGKRVPWYCCDYDIESITAEDVI